MILDEYTQMCQAAIEIQKKWQPKDGDLFYSFYSKEDQQFIKKNFKGESSGFFSYITNLKFLDGSSGSCTKHLKAKCIWIPRQEDLQNIYFGDEQIKHFYFEWLDDYIDLFGCNKESGENLTLLWLVFIMGELYDKFWDKDSKQWVKG